MEIGLSEVGQDWDQGRKQEFSISSNICEACNQLPPSFSK